MRVLLRFECVFFLALVMSACDGAAPFGSPTVKVPNSQSPTTSDPPADPEVPGGLTGSASLDTEELAFLDLINDYREQNGRTRLAISVALTQAADWLSVDMVTKNYFSHTDSLGRDIFSRIRDQFGYVASTTMGENIAWGNSGAQATFNQWKSSSGHNQNMLSSYYKAIGIGRANTGSSAWYWTTDFGGAAD